MRHANIQTRTHPKIAYSVPPHKRGGKGRPSDYERALEWLRESKAAEIAELVEARLRKAKATKSK